MDGWEKPFSDGTRWLFLGDRWRGRILASGRLLTSAAETLHTHTRTHTHTYTPKKEKRKKKRDCDASFLGVGVGGGGLFLGSL